VARMSKVQNKTFWLDNHMDWTGSD